MWCACGESEMNLYVSTSSDEIRLTHATALSSVPVRGMIQLKEAGSDPSRLSHLEVDT